MQLKFFSKLMNELMCWFGDLILGKTMEKINIKDYTDNSSLCIFGFFKSLLMV